jgi:hypothetical protein
MSDPWKFIYEQTGFDPLDRYAREEREKCAAAERRREEFETRTAAARWEYCEIVCKEAGFLGFKSYFVAQAVGSKGRYEAARSTKTLRTVSGAPDTYSIGSKPLAEAALDEIMAKLSADGWELTGEKGKWWEYKYRRRERS